MIYTVSYWVASNAGSRTFLIPQAANEWRDFLIRSGIPSACVIITMVRS